MSFLEELVEVGEGGMNFLRVAVHCGTKTIVVVGDLYPLEEWLTRLLSILFVGRGWHSASQSDGQG